MNKHKMFLFALFALALGTSGAALANDDEEPRSEFRHACPEKAEGKLVIHHIAVGQGDATFIRTPKGRTMLIDAGVPGRGEDDIVPTLQRCYGIKNIDYYVLTHFDQDHHGGMGEVLEALPPKLNIYDPGDKYNGKNQGPGSAFKRYADAVKATGRKRVIPAFGRAGFRMPQGDPTQIALVAVNGSVLNPKDSAKPTKVNILTSSGKVKNDNAISMAMTIKLGDFDYFIGGDLTGGGKSTPDVETPTADVVGDVDVLHANHHGSETSNNEYFLNKLKPEHVVISVGTGGINVSGKYFLPTASVVERMNVIDYIRKIFQTSEGASKASREEKEKKTEVTNSDIIIVADTDSYSINGKAFATDGRQPQ